MLAAGVRPRRFADGGAGAPGGGERQRHGCPAYAGRPVPGCAGSRCRRLRARYGLGLTVYGAQHLFRHAGPARPADFRSVADFVHRLGAVGPGTVAEYKGTPRERW